VATDETVAHAELCQRVIRPDADTAGAERHLCLPRSYHLLGLENRVGISSSKGVVFGPFLFIGVTIFDIRQAIVVEYFRDQLHCQPGAARHVTPEPGAAIPSTPHRAIRVWLRHFLLHKRGSFMDSLDGWATYSGAHRSGGAQ
jgi:hypothetical protein